MTEPAETDKFTIDTIETVQKNEPTESKDLESSNQPLLISKLNANIEHSNREENVADCVSVSKSTGSNDPVCRICHLEEASQRENLICPCLCKGSMKVVHETCLLKWLNYNREFDF